MENNYYQKTSVARIIAIILACILAVAGITGLFVVIANKNKEDARPNYIQEGLVMNAKPTLRLSDPSGIRFTAKISNELAYEVNANENKSFGMVLAPVSYFMKVDTRESYKEIDWINAFAEESLTSIALDGSARQVASADGTTLEYNFNGAIVGVKYKNTNLQFLGIAYVKTTDGENVSYRYASFPEGISYKQCAYSYAYVVAETLNNYYVGNLHLAQSDLEMCKGVINNSVDLANGLSEEDKTDDGSTYAVTLSTTEKTLAVGEQLKLDVEIAEGVKVPIWWLSENSSIASIKDGTVTANAEGSVKVYAIVAGKEYSCVITVSNTNTEAVA